MYKNLFLIIFFLGYINVSNAFISHYHAPKQSFEQINEQYQHQKLLESCNFSSFRTWDSEVERIQKNIVGLDQLIKMVSDEIYWANKDISKQDFLPSETVRNAYSQLSVNQMMNAKYQEMKVKNIFCLDCALKRKNGASDC